MAKLTPDEMFRTIDQVSDFLEANLGRDFMFKREVDAIILAFPTKARATPAKTQIDTVRTELRAYLGL